jgi:hypothetical protein
VREIMISQQISGKVLTQLKTDQLPANIRQVL